MAESGSRGKSLNPERVSDQALIALKKGTSLIKYSRKGKPKFCPFRISPDETTLVWYSHKEERNLKFESVSKIIPGQRTAVFRRFSCPEKDYLSFSLLYNNGERSLDLICKDKDEAEAWFAGLKALISKSQHRTPRANHEYSVDLDGGSIRNGRCLRAIIDDTLSISHTLERKSSIKLSSSDPFVDSPGTSDAGSNRANMYLRTSNGEGFRNSISSAPSSSSQGSGADDCESLGDVYIWGEVWIEGGDGSLNSSCSKTDVLIPRPLETNVVLDVRQISCGVQHAALVTRQGEIFTWGEDSGGRLGLATDRHVSKPQLVELLDPCNVESVSCGEYHTCAVSVYGELFSWGDGTLNAGLLGQGNDVSHWIPKRVCGPLEGKQVLSVSCGAWHSSLITSDGKLFTFGDGSFGVLGHGDRESAPYPREVETLSGLKTISVACGVWHSAAIVEVIETANIDSRKLFTWGDGDKYRLGHGDKKARLIPTCIESLVDYNFHQLACGHTMTIALTTSGRVFTMGSTAYGQLGNPQSEGKLPSLVQSRLTNEVVEDIACGSYHVVVLTSRSEVFTWGKGENGRLGHGDTEDRKMPTFVESLKDRHVKSISCGSNFTASVCIHKWVSGADQSVCSGCRQAFGFTRKRHNCYNCGLVHCHACSSKKVLRAALAPTPGKPHRVCDSCYSKLRAAESSRSLSFNRRPVAHQRSATFKDKSTRGAINKSKALFSPVIRPVRRIEIKTAKTVKRFDAQPQLKEIYFPSHAVDEVLKPIVTSTTSHVSNSRPASASSGKSSPAFSATPVVSRIATDSVKKTNELLNQEKFNLQAEVRSLKQKCEIYDAELIKYQKKSKEYAVVVGKESSKCDYAVEIIKSLAQQMAVSEKLPPELSDNIQDILVQAEIMLKSCAKLKPSKSDQHYRLKEGSSLGDEQKLRNSTDGSRPPSTMTLDDSNHVNSPISDKKDIMPDQNTENVLRTPRKSKKNKDNDGETEIIENFEHGIYVTLVQLQDGTRAFKRIRFSKRRFTEQQAEEWWQANQERVLTKYGHLISDVSSPTS